MKILIVEDDKKIVSILEKFFKEENINFDIAYDGLEAKYLVEINSYDIIILDWMLPEIFGIDLINIIRKNSNSFILMLTAKDDINDKVKALNLGADDYLTKPFSLAELLARINALYRRKFNSSNNEIKFRDLKINLDKKNVLKNNKEIILNKKEYDLLLFLIKNKNKIVSKNEIEQNLWNNEEFILSNVLEVTIYNLRKKIGKTFIKSYRNLGYQIK